MTTFVSLTDLITLSRQLAEKERQLVIIGEGNTSCRADDDTFWVKASGHTLHNIGADGFVQVAFSPILDLFESELSGEALVQAASAARVDPSATVRPSIEVMFHALLLAEYGASVIAHTHPVAVNSILCSTRAAQFAHNRIFPDEVVVCGPRSVLIPYTDPGLPLARAIREGVKAYLDEQGEPPKVVLLQNHGLIALGRTPADAFNITAMCVKAAQIFIGACAVGDPVFMSQDDIAHIYQRPDELYRRAKFL